MKWNIYFIVINESIGKVVEIPNNTNPVECINMASLLDKLKDNLPGQQWGLEVIGLRIELAKRVYGQSDGDQYEKKG